MSMTEEQREKFLLYGCLSRALMKVCNKTSVEDFCSKYEKWFRSEYFGMPRWDKVEAILNDLGYTAVVDEADFSKVREHYRAGKSVIVLSHVSLNPNETNEINHASVLHDISDESFQLWTTSQDGSEGITAPLTKNDWVSKKCHGLCVKSL